MIKYLTILLLLFSVAVFGQEKRGTIKVKKVEKVSDEVIRLPYSVVDQMPFLADMNQFIETNIKYPDKERKEEISGIVYLTFVVEADGSLSNIKVLRGVSGGPGCDKEALRIVSLMPKWTPGKDNGVAVPVQCNLPIKFQIK